MDKKQYEKYIPCVFFDTAFEIIQVCLISFILAYFLQFSVYRQPLPEAGTERLTFRDRAKSQPLSL